MFVAFIFNGLIGTQRRLAQVLAIAGAKAAMQRDDLSFTGAEFTLGNVVVNIEIGFAPGGLIAKVCRLNAVQGC